MNVNRNTNPPIFDGNPDVSLCSGQKKNGMLERKADLLGVSSQAGGL